MVAAVLALAAAMAAPPQSRPQAKPRRAPAATAARVEYSTALETVMLLALLAAPGPSLTEFQGQARARFGASAGHGAVRETAAILAGGLKVEDLARLATLMAPAPIFEFRTSEEIQELAATLPGGNLTLSVDRLHGYARLVREFYRDLRVARFFLETAPYYREMAQRKPPPDAPAGAKFLVSPLCPAPRIQFARRSPRAVTYVILGG